MNEREKKETEEAKRKGIDENTISHPMTMWFVCTDTSTRVCTHDTCVSERRTSE